MNTMSQIRQITEIGILTAMITILGAIKIPNLVPGIEFQLSAPLAVAICAAFGFKKVYHQWLFIQPYWVGIGDSKFSKCCYCYAI